MGVAGVVGLLCNVKKRDIRHSGREEKRWMKQAGKRMKNISETQDFKPISGKIYNHCLVIF